MIVPKFLSPGDKVGIIATAKKVDKENTIKGVEILESWGLRVKTGLHLFHSHHQFAGTDDQRIEDFQQMINDQEIKAIFVARGGYGTTRIIDNINFDPLKSSPKWICGFSDITAIHLHLFNLGIAGLHSPMPSFFHTLDEKSLVYVKESIFGIQKKILVNPHHLNRIGTATGRLVGGNLSIICNTIGTKSQIKTSGNILFIEDIGEQLYHLDRMMVQLKRIGLLSKLSGMIVGQFSEMEDSEDSFGKTAYEIIHSHMTDFDYPVAFDFPIGHTRNNYAVPIGLISNVIVDSKSASLVLD